MLDHPIKAGMDIAGLALMLGAFVNWLPAISAGIAGVWYAIQIIEHFRNKK